MLKLFTNQRKISAVLLRTCSRAVVSSSLRNTDSLKYCSRSMSDDNSSNSTRLAVVNFPSTSYFHRWSLSNSDKEDYSMVLMKMEGDAEKNPRTVPLTRGDYQVWSLTANDRYEGHSLMKLEAQGDPEIKFSGRFDDRTGACVVQVQDRSTPGKPRVSLGLSVGQEKYYVSVEKHNVVAKPEDEAGKIERFIHRKHGSYSLFECHRLRDQYLGCNHEDGSLVLIQVEDILHPDPRVLFVMHAKGSNRSSP